MRYTLALSMFPATVAFAQSAPALMMLGDVIVTGTCGPASMPGIGSNRSSGGNQYAYSGNLLRLYCRKAQEWDRDAELAAPLLLALPDNATAAAPQGALGLGSN